GDMGALSAGADPETQQAFGAFGSSLGMAFQVVDDLLGVWAPEIETGKTAALDVSTRKKALPAILCLSKTGSGADRFRALYALDRQLNREETSEAIGILNELGVQRESTEYARRYRDEAIGRLDALGSRYDVSALRQFLLGTLPTTD